MKKIIAFLAVFLPSSLIAQEQSLYGTWEGPIGHEFSEWFVVLLTFNPDKTFVIEGDFNPLADIGTVLGIEDLITTGEEDPFGVPDEIQEVAKAIVARMASLKRMSGSGTYQVVGDDLSLTYGEVEFIVDGESMNTVEFWGPFIEFSARFIFAVFTIFGLAFDENVTEEEIEEELLRAYENAPSDPEYQESVEAFYAWFEKDPLLISLSGTYVVEGNALLVSSPSTDDEGNEIMETVEFHRASVFSQGQDDEYPPLSDWVIAPNQISVRHPETGTYGSRTCIKAKGSKIVSSKWQWRMDAEDAWQDIPDSELEGGMCAMDPEDPGEYRMVGIFLISGRETKYSSGNTIVIEGKEKKESSTNTAVSTWGKIKREYLD